MDSPRKVAPDDRDRAPAGAAEPRPVAADRLARPRRARDGRRRRADLPATGRPSPAPFGLANNGLVAYAEAGDIFTVDPETGARRQITTGLDGDANPRLSPDGSRIAFLRGAGLSKVVIVDADGGNPVTSLDGILETDEDGFEWAPDGSAVAVTGRVVGEPSSSQRAGSTSSTRPTARSRASVPRTSASSSPGVRRTGGSCCSLERRHRPHPAALCRRYRARRGGTSHLARRAGRDPAGRLDGRRARALPTWSRPPWPGCSRRGSSTSRPARSSMSRSPTATSRMTARGSQVSWATTAANRASRPSRGASADRSVRAARRPRRTPRRACTGRLTTAGS